MYLKNHYNSFNFISKKNIKIHRGSSTHILRHFFTIFTHHHLHCSFIFSNNQHNLKIQFPKISQVIPESWHVVFSHTHFSLLLDSKVSTIKHLLTIPIHEVMKLKNLSFPSEHCSLTFSLTLPFPSCFFVCVCVLHADLIRHGATGKNNV